MSDPVTLVPNFEEIAVYWPVPERFRDRITAVVGAPGRLWKRGWHAGTDFACPVGTPVLACWDGLVRGAGPGLGPEGTFAVIMGERDGKPFEHLYFHLSETVLQFGQTVKAGDRVGYSGNTGNSTGPHLHFQLQRWTGNRRDFLRPRFTLPPAPPPAAVA